MNPLIKNLKEAQAQATKGPYYYDHGNGSIESQHKEHFRISVAHRNDLSERLAHSKDFELKIAPPNFPVNPDCDMEFLTLAANSVTPLIEYAEDLQATIERQRALLKASDDEWGEKAEFLSPADQAIRDYLKQDKAVK